SIPDDLLESMVEQEPWMAKNQNRRPRPREALAALVDTSVWREAQAGLPVKSNSTNRWLQSERTLPLAAHSSRDRRQRETRTGTGRRNQPGRNRDHDWRVSNHIASCLAGNCSRWPTPDGPRAGPRALLR